MNKIILCILISFKFMIIIQSYTMKSNMLKIIMCD